MKEQYSNAALLRMMKRFSKRAPSHGVQIEVADGWVASTIYKKKVKQRKMAKASIKKNR